MAAAGPSSLLYMWLCRLLCVTRSLIASVAHRPALSLLSSIFYVHMAASPRGMGGRCGNRRKRQEAFRASSVTHLFVFVAFTTMNGFLLFGFPNFTRTCICSKWISITIRLWWGIFLIRHTCILYLSFRLGRSSPQPGLLPAQGPGPGQW